MSRPAVSAANENAELATWLAQNGAPDQLIEPRVLENGGVGCAARRDIKAGEAVLCIPEALAVTRVDVLGHPLLGPVAKGRDDLVGLALWLMLEQAGAEREGATWRPYAHPLPAAAASSPLLWPPEERQRLLQGSPVLADVEGRLAALAEEFTALHSSHFQKDLEAFPPARFTVGEFQRAFAAVLSRGTYLPAADLFALVPLADMVRHSAASSASLDYNEDAEAVMLVADRDFRTGEEVVANRALGRPNSELLISHGFVDNPNPNDYLELEVALVEADPLYRYKLQLVREAGFESRQRFPLFEDRFPSQLLSFMRLARLQDAAQLPRATFGSDTIISQANEYEVLMLLMADCRDRLAAYASTLDDDARLLQKRGLGANERAAAQLRLSEKRILSNTMAGLRARLAPIRGVPAKGGAMRDPNSDIKEMFDIVEQGFAAPMKLMKGFLKK